MWIEHQDELYNLDHFSQIVRGDENEILLVKIYHNEDWDNEDHKNIIVLSFDNKESRELAYTILRVKTGSRYIGKLIEEFPCEQPKP